MQLSQEWDKTFPKSEKVEHQKGHVQEPLRHHPGRRPVSAEGSRR